MNFLATFYTHFGAMSFDKHCRRAGIHAKMGPVPRELSSSCGVCVRFETETAPEPSKHEDMEQCYAIRADGTFQPLEEER